MTMGGLNFFETKNLIDSFFHYKLGLIMKLPTGQVIYFHKKS